MYGLRNWHNIQLTTLGLLAMEIEEIKFNQLRKYISLLLALISDLCNKNNDNNNKSNAGNM